MFIIPYYAPSADMVGFHWGAVLFLLIGVVFVIIGVVGKEDAYERPRLNERVMTSSDRSRLVYGRGTAGLICAVLSLALGWIATLLGLLLGIGAMALGLSAMNQRMRYGVALASTAILLGLAGYLMSFVYIDYLNVPFVVAVIAVLFVGIVLTVASAKRRSRLRGIE